MKKTIHLDRPVAEAVRAWPEVKEILFQTGFKNISSPAALATAGKIVTIAKGASMLKIPLMDVVRALEENGFEVKGASLPEEQDQNGFENRPSVSDKEGMIPALAPNQTPEPKTSQIAMLKDYIRRLSNGEDLESVRTEFIQNFEAVEADEIMEAEQQLMQEGLKISDVQRLCDVHSALFHGRTRAEQIANAEKAVEAAIQRKQMAENPQNRPGHPLHTLFEENKAIEAAIASARKTIADEKQGSHLDEANWKEMLEELRKTSAHYAKKGDLLYPLLNRSYGISGPSNVMWGVDDEIRDELGALIWQKPDAKTLGRLEAVLKRMEEMIYKENHILFPLCLRNFSREDWMRIYYELPAYLSLCEEPQALWQEAEDSRKALRRIGAKPAQAVLDRAAASAGSWIHDGMVVLGTGTMRVEEILAVLNTIPMELTFVDRHDINRFFNDGEKVFKRPEMAIGRDVFSCHPPKIEAMVRGILDSFKDGSKNSTDVWMEKNGDPFLVRYLAVRNEKGEYLGVLECVQNMAFARDHFLSKTDSPQNA